jgi:hypothetical protein
MHVAFLLCVRVVWRVLQHFVASGAEPFIFVLVLRADDIQQMRGLLTVGGTK